MSGFADEARAEGPPQFIEPDDALGTSQAVVVGGSAELVHTTQLLPLDDQGRIVGPGQADVQAGVLLDHLAHALRDAGSSVDHLVKLNVAAASSEAVAAFQRTFAERVKDSRARPAVGFVSGMLPHPEAQLALDAVAIRPQSSGVENVTYIDSRALASQRLGAPGAILPAGGKVYIAGQAEAAEDLREATRKTLESLAATLEALGLDRSDVVQVKSFLTPMAAIDEAMREVSAFFEDQQAIPPLVFVEWHSSLPIEIELIAASPRREDREALEYLAAPGLEPSPIFSRVARVNHGPLIYVSGLYGPPGSGSTEQIEAIFERLQGILSQAGSDLRHLVKATYYVADDEVSRLLNELRPNYYDPRRPPAASKALVTGVGSEGRSITLDMIAVPRPASRGGRSGVRAADPPGSP